MMAQATQTQTPTQTATPAPPLTLDEALEALKRYKAGDDSAMLAALDEAVRDVHGNPAKRSALEQRLTSHLGASSSSVARAYVCRILAIIGSAASVPAVAPLLLDDELSVFARMALERIPGQEADRALRDAVAKARGRTRIGIVNSVAARRDARGVGVLAKAAAEEADVAPAVAKALGEIGTVEAATALESFRGKGTPTLRLAVADGTLICAERLVESGDKELAVKLLESLTDASQPEYVRKAANRGLSAARSTW